MTTKSSSGTTEQETICLNDRHINRAIKDRRRTDLGSQHAPDSNRIRSLIEEGSMIEDSVWMRGRTESTHMQLQAGKPVREEVRVGTTGYERRKRETRVQRVMATKWRARYENTWSDELTCEVPQPG